MIMKKVLSTIGLGLTIMSFTACATKPEGLSKMPVVVQGKTSKTPLTKRITLVPAGTSIPVNITIKGDVFTEDVKKIIPVVLKNNTYFYSSLKDIQTANAYEKFLVSYDKKRWVTLDEAFSGQLQFAVEITDEKSAINLSFQANQKVE